MNRAWLVPLATVRARLLVRVWLFVLSALVPMRSAAQDAEASAPCEFERYMLLAATPGFETALADEVRKDLAVELAPRGFGVCAAPAQAGELVAEIRLSQPDPAIVSIDVDDHTTGKRVGRDVKLARIPAGGRALAIAIAADELLRASWAELILRRTEPEPDEADTTSPSRRVGEKRLPVSARSSWRYVSVDTGFELGMLLGYSHAASSWDAGTFLLRGQVRPFGWGWLSFGAGAVLAHTVDVPLGQAGARGVLLDLTVGACSTTKHSLNVCGGVQGSAYLLQFRGSSASGAAGLEDHAAAFVVSGVGQLRLSLTDRLAAVLELGLGGAVAAALATDGARSLMGLEGFVLSSGLGLGVSL